MSDQIYVPKVELWRPWLKALHSGDCVTLQNLLRLDPWYVLVYPSSALCDFTQAKRIIQNPLEGMTEWEGSSVLHVAVRQGCGQLVGEVFRVFCSDESDVLGTGSAEVPFTAAEQTMVTSSTSGSSTLGGNRSQRLRIKHVEPMENLLLAQEPSSGLEALAQAVMNGQEEMVKQLVLASLSLDSNPYELPFVSEDVISRSKSRINIEKEVSRIQHHVLKIIQGVLKAIGATESKTLEKEFSELHDFNFLPWPLFLFHAACSKRSEAFDNCREKIIQLALKQGPPSVGHIFGLLDGQARTPLHVAVAAGADTGIMGDILSRIPEGEEYADSLNSKDGAGRTALHWAILREEADKEVALLLTDARTDVNAVFQYNMKILEYIDFEKLCARNGFRISRSEWKNTHKSTVLHLALWSPCTKIVKVVQTLLKDPRLKLSLTSSCYIDSSYDRLDPSPFGIHKDGHFFLTPLQLAAISGNASILQLLAHDDRAYDSGRLNNATAFNELRSKVEEELITLYSTLPGSKNVSYMQEGDQPTLKKKRIDTWVKIMNTSSLHCAAAVGNPAAVRIILNTRKFDPLLEDTEGNTALHYAAYARDSIPSIGPNLLDCPSWCSSLVSRIKTQQAAIHEPATSESRRQGCINLLLQSGIDIWKTNKEGSIADPGARASPEACSWWYEKLARETLETKQSLNAAANAVSVTAALVATASYVGPLQPPLGYFSNEQGAAEHIQVEYVAIRMFIVCDTVAFYVALCAIMLSLIPSLPMPQESMLDELVSTRRSVTLAVAFLILSIIAIIFAFASASVSVIPNDDGSWNLEGLTVGPVIVGSIFCMLIMYMICLRLIRLTFHRNFWFRRHYRHITLF